METLWGMGLAMHFVEGDAMSDMYFLLVAPAIFHVAFVIGVEMVSSSDENGRGYLLRAVKTKEHFVGVTLAIGATILLVAGNRESSLVISILIAALMILDVIFIFRAFSHAKIVSEKIK